MLTESRQPCPTSGGLEGTTPSSACIPTPKELIDRTVEGATGLFIVPAPQICDGDGGAHACLPQFSVSRLTETDVFRARHVHELSPSGEGTVYVRLDAAQRGLGTGSCGPQTLEMYRVHGGRAFDIEFMIKPLG